MLSKYAVVSAWIVIGVLSAFGKLAGLQGSMQIICQLRDP